MDSQTLVKSRLDYWGSIAALINSQHYTKWNQTYCKFFLPSSVMRSISKPENANSVSSNFGSRSHDLQELAQTSFSLQIHQELYIENVSECSMDQLEWDSGQSQVGTLGPPWAHNATEGLDPEIHPELIHNHEDSIDPAKGDSPKD